MSISIAVGDADDFPGSTTIDLQEATEKYGLVIGMGYNYEVMLFYLFQAVMILPNAFTDLQRRE